MPTVPEFLLAGVDPVGEAVVRGDVIELAGRLVVPAGPGPAAVDADGRALVGARGHVVGVGRVDPDEVVVVPARRATEDLTFGAAFGAAAHRLADQPDHVRIARVDGDAARIVVGEGAALVHLRPARPAVVRAPEAARGAEVDRRIEAQARGRARGRHADPAERARGPALAAEPGPGRAAVGGAPEGAAGPGDRGEVALPGVLPRGPGGGEDHVRIVRIAGEVGDAGPVVDLQRLRPGPAAVGGAEDAPRRARAEEVADGAHQDRVRVIGADPDAADVLGVGQAQRAPGPAAVVGAEHAFARGHVVARLGLAGPGVDHVGVRRRYGDRADRRGTLVEHGAPGPARVVRAPDPAAGGPEEEGVGPARHAFDHLGPAAPQRADQPPVQVAPQGGRGAVGRPDRSAAQRQGRRGGSDELPARDHAYLPNSPKRR